MCYNYKYDKIGVITKQGDKYSINQLCDMFCVTPKTIMNWADSGELESKIDEKTSHTNNVICESDYEKFFF